MKLLTCKPKLNARYFARDEKFMAEVGLLWLALWKTQRRNKPLLVSTCTLAVSLYVRESRALS